MRLTLLALFVLASLTVLSQDSETKTTITKLVNRWSEIHNSKNVDKFDDLYAPIVLFYGSYKEKAKCIKEKTTFLKNTFHQEIISPLQFKYYSSGIIKCSFTKEVTYKQKVKQYPAYLLFQKNENNYLITGESDSITDQNLNIVLNIGQEVEPQQANNTIAYAGVILVGFAIIIFYIIREKKHLKALSAQSTRNYTATNQQEKIVTAQNSTLQKTELTEKEKGDAFEKFVVERFKSEFYTIKEWRSDKFHKGHYAISNMHPDIVYEFKSKMHCVTFAVECKWRSDFYNGCIEWAKDYQFENYKNYERENNICVFIIIGIGGNPDYPASLYIVPLKDIYSHILPEHFLKRYYRYGKSNFFLYADTMKLS